MGTTAGKPRGDSASSGKLGTLCLSRAGEKRPLLSDGLRARTRSPGRQKQSEGEMRRSLPLSRGRELRPTSPALSAPSQGAVPSLGDQDRASQGQSPPPWSRLACAGLLSRHKGTWKGGSPTRLCPPDFLGGLRLMPPFLTD